MASCAEAVMTQRDRLVDVTEAAASLGLSPTFLYRLPASTPGVYKFGAAKRFDAQILREWARKRKCKVYRAN